MQIFTVNVSDSALEEFYSFIASMPKDKIGVLSNSSNDWSFLEPAIQKAIDSGVSPKTHDEIIENIRQKYV